MSRLLEFANTPDRDRFVARFGPNPMRSAGYGIGPRTVDEALEPVG